jgi:hypothetical protein
MHSFVFSFHVQILDWFYARSGFLLNAETNLTTFAIFTINLKSPRNNHFGNFIRDKSKIRDTLGMSLCREFKQY